MDTTRALSLAAACLLCAAPALGQRSAAVLVGENAGDELDAPLQFAESDASAMRDVLVSVGGVRSQDALLLRGASAARLRATLADVATQLSREKADRLIVYVSSHAAAGELHLGGTRFPIAALRRFIDEAHAGLAVLILDTCEAGSALRTKGVLPLSSRLIELEKPSVTGRVVIASSGPAESAFESTELGGSLFTQHLIAGLRGAADTSRDGRVTLQEAYAYAYTRTLDSIAALRASAQTPSFDLDIEGAGEIVLTEPGKAGSRLALDFARPGEWQIASLDGGTRLSRFVKATGPAVFALEPGTFRLRTRSGDSYAQDVVTLREGEAAHIVEGDLERWALVPAGRKGGEQTSMVAAAALASTGPVPGFGVLKGFALTVRRSFSALPLGLQPVVQLSSGWAEARSPDRAVLEQDLPLLLGLGVQASFERLGVSLCGEAGGDLLLQQTGATRLQAVEPRFDVQLGASFQFSRGWFAEAAGTFGVSLLRTYAQGRHPQTLGELRAGVGRAF